MADRCSYLQLHCWTIQHRDNFPILSIRLGGHWMPTNLATIAVILLFVAPGFVYYGARSNAERQAREQRGGLSASPSWTNDPLRQIVDSIIVSTFLSGAAIGSLFFLRWIISWFISYSVFPSPEAWIAQGWDYVPDHWQLVVVAAAAELAIALTLARLLGNMQGRADVFAEELVLEQSDIARSHAVVQLRSGTIYSGVVPGRPRHGFCARRGVGSLRPH
jgi:Family of unknown function (DUF6338)